ncbi:MAG: SDR family NAD(P)-dependent oxidoreductase [Longimicrobiaceae bacterium]
MTPGIAIVGLACRYPDAPTPAALWENALAQRRAFRPIPPERLRLADYAGEPDGTYVAEAAVLEGWEFDRVRFRVSGEAFRAADPAHWLALEVAADALADAGFPGGEGLPREAAGVLLGNSLTGEFSRAGALRLRWPYVRRVAGAALADAGWGIAERERLLGAMEAAFKAPFPEPGGETLAGGLSNTIAGRICNHFDLHGGGYTVDGACASSLLAVANACSALAAGELDVALAGGVDLSLDPFELVGFARAGALAAGEMRVFDRRPGGFLPGEGCGMAVLMRLPDALALRRVPYAVIRGWGVSSDGSGGLTRPEAAGQLLALRRAYARAGFGAETVALFEGHGTGTEVGDATELRALAEARRGGGAVPPAVVGSVKAIVGHTKAAAGIAGMIKAAMALHARVVPPTAGCREPHAELCGDAPALRVEAEGGAWPDGFPLRAGVSSFGFGGINAHVALEGVSPERSGAVPAAVEALLRSHQDAELFLLDADDSPGLVRRAERLRERGARLSRAELGDAAAALHAELAGGRVRAALVAATAAELARGADVLLGWLRSGAERGVDARGGVFLGPADAAPRVGFLFPGQGSPSYPGGGLARRRFAAFAAAYRGAGLSAGGDGVATEVAQPAITAASAAALALLRELGIEAAAAVGHSLGELAALHWAGALSPEALLRTAAARGRAMAELGEAGGAMLAVRAPADDVAELLAGTDAVVAGVNAPDRTAVAGSAAAVERVAARAAARGWEARRLAVSHAFHSPLVAAAAGPLARHLAAEEVGPPARKVASTVAGRVLGPDDDLRALLVRQVTEPVLFRDALAALRDEVELWIEVGPGRVLAGLAAEQVDAPVLATDAGGPSVAGVLAAAGCAWALGAPVRTAALFAGRFVRPIDLDRAPRFLANPCETAPVSSAPAAPAAEARPSAEAAGSAPAQGSALEVVRALVAERAELPAAAVGDGDLLLGDLHLNSIVVGQMVAEAARRLGLAAPAMPAEYSGATVAQVAEALEEVRARGAASPAADDAAPPAGVDAWVRPWVVRMEERPLAPPRSARRPGAWRVLGGGGDPLASALAGRSGALPGSGVAVCLPAELDGGAVDLLLQAARALGELPGGVLVVAQRGGGGAGFARTLHLERPATGVVVVDVPPDDPRAAGWVAAEAAAALPGRYAEARYGADGVRREPVLAAAPPGAGGAVPLGPDDVLLVTGGGKGIAAECALALARGSGARLALLGRSRPESDPALAANLERFAAHGIVFRYLAADVGDPAAIAAAVRAAGAALGPVTGVLHGAGSNLPRRIESLDADAFREALRPKTDGLRAVLAAVDPGRLRLLVAFSSIIARTGLRGEAHYALANEWMGREVERFAAARPGCRCLSLEWSVWSGVGMGERLGVLEGLAREGVTPIPVDAGVAALPGLLAAPPGAVCVTVAGRFGPPPTVRLAGAELPLRRFLERPRVHYPGVELVADSVLAPATDPYLDDHVVRGERLFPAVMGLEAMAQAAMALAGAAERPAFEDVAFHRPVVVGRGGSETIRVAALARGPGEVEVVLRAESTGFAVDHFRARCRFGAAAAADPVPPAPAPPGVELDPARDLYGGLLFHGGRFRRIAGYRRLAARECVADVTAGDGDPWFGAFLPAALELCDPGARDAAIHAIQACIPHALLLPVGVERIATYGPAAGPVTVHARERSGDGESFVWDVVVADGAGRVAERWDGLRLRRVADLPVRDEWPEALLAPYLERRIGELAPSGSIRVAIHPGGNGNGRRRGSDAALGGAAGGAAVLRRPDGRPEVAAGPAVSASHGRAVTLGVAGPGVGADVERVVPRASAAWRGLLGAERQRLAEQVAAESGEDGDTAATRVWCAGESLKKGGAAPDAPLVLASLAADGWVVLRSGPRVIPTYAGRVRGEGPLALAVAVEPDGSGG